MNDSLNTAPHAFGDCDINQRPLFAVNGGIALEDALVNISQLLKCAGETAYGLSDCGLPQRELIGATLHWPDAG
ncbi:DUF3077 domain-containing protein [Pseudomonas sp. TE3610]